MYKKHILFLLFVEYKDKNYINMMYSFLKINLIFIDMKSKFLVYGLQDPFNQQIRYVGKSSNGLRRPRMHFYKSIYDGTEKGTHCHNWIKKCISLNQEPKIIILNNCIDNSEAIQMEIFWIWYMKNIMFYKLTNITEGGEGSLGRKLSQKSKDKIGNKNRGRIKTEKERIDISNRMKINNPTKGKIRTIQERINTSIYKGRREILVHKAIDNSFVGKWNLASVCSKELNVSQNDICAVLKGRQQTAKGYVFSSQSQIQC